MTRYHIYRRPVVNIGADILEPMNDDDVYGYDYDDSGDAFGIAVKLTEDDPEYVYFVVPIAESAELLNLADWVIKHIKEDMIDQFFDGDTLFQDEYESLCTACAITGEDPNDYYDPEDEEDEDGIS